MKQQHKAKLNKILNFYIGVGVFFWIVAVVLIFTPIVPQIWYNLNPNAYANELKSLTLNETEDIDYFSNIRDQYAEQLEEKEVEEERKLPPFDDSLPLENTLIIKKMGVNAEIQTGADAKTALQNGPWIVDNFGKPDDQFAPIIIASHRWGGIGWSSAKRATHSFLKIPDLEAGDEIEIIWNQRKYIYSIYAGQENTKITDYNADLILYTCKLYWESPIRLFKYAERVQ